MYIQQRKGEIATQTETGVSKIIGEGFTCFPKTSSENKTYTKYSLKLHCYVAFNTELHSRKINVPEHQ